MIGREKENTEKSLTQISSAWMGIANRECQLAFLPQLTQSSLALSSHMFNLEFTIK